MRGACCAFRPGHIIIEFHFRDKGSSHERLIRDESGMPLTAPQKRNLFLLAKERWIEAESRLFAYERRFRKKERFSTLMSYVSIFSAVVAAIAAQFPNATWLATTGALITAILTGVDKVFAPAADADRYWKSRSDIDAIKRDLVDAAYEIEMANDLAAGTHPFNVMSDRIAQVTTPFDLTEEDKQRAQDGFARSAMFTLLYPPAPPLSDDAPVEIASDAPGIIPMADPLR